MVAMVIAAAGGPVAVGGPYQVSWSRQIGTSSSDYSNAVAVDGSGNAYISGYTAGSLGGTNAGGIDAFLTKYDTSGNVLWTRQIGTSSSDYSSSVAADGSGNVYISGYTSGALGGTSAGGVDAFLTKYDTSGNVLWSRQIGTSGGDYSKSVAVDGSGNVYISGYTSGALGGTNAGGNDAFLTKYDPSGNVLWSRQIGTSSSDYGNAVAVDGSGNIYISGYTSGSLGGTSAGGVDAFLTKYDASGNVLWSRQIGTSSSDYGRSVAVDGSGNAYLTGYTSGSLGGTSAGGVDAFLTKYDTLGNVLWSRQIGTSGGDYSYSVAVDRSGNAYLSGSTDGSFGDVVAGRAHAFLVMYGRTGQFLWSREIGSLGYDYSVSVAVDGSANAYISGYTTGDLGGTNVGVIDAFLVKYFDPPATVSLLALPNALPSNGHFVGVLEIQVRGSGGQGLEGLAASIGIVPSGSGAVLIGAVTEAGGGLYLASLTGTAKGDVTLTGTVGGTAPPALLPVVVYTAGEDGWPVANAGPDQNVSDVDPSGSETVILNGTTSYDHEGPVCGWRWFLNGSQIASGPVAPVLLTVGTHKVILVVEDGEGKVDMDEVRVTVTPSLAVTATMAFSWVYQNTEVSTANRHQSLMTVTIAEGFLEGESYLINITENGGPVVNFRVDQGVVATSRATGVFTGGGQRDASTPSSFSGGAYQPYILNVTVSGMTRGQTAHADVPLVLRRLGDIDGDGLVNSADKLEINKKLNGLANLPGITLRDLDLTGDGALVNAEDKLAINQVLNGLAVP
jgi:hypothetical protein